ncbi:MAG: hypothetical protein MI725_16490, partial [Pirellulales bacterium]|nr:hypothetical protein [Pirellulales bacterium]
MKHFITILTIVAAGVLSGTSATAEDEAGDRPNLSDKREKMIEQFDADGDGQLSDQERATARSQRGKRQGRAGRQRGQGRGQRPDGPPDPARLFERFDENGDDQLSREEFMRLSAAVREMRERSGQGRSEGRRRAAREDRP